MKVIAIILAVAVLFTSCSTVVRIDTPDVPNASVKINGQPVGETPLTKTMSDAIWENYDVEIVKEGYQPYKAQLQKEIKVGALIGGIIVWPFLLWVYGPEPYQEIYLDSVETAK